MVLSLISTSETSPHDVVAVPSRQCGDLSRTEWAKTLLLFPESKQLPPSPKVVYRFHVKTLLKVPFPFGVIRIGFALKLGMSFNGHTPHLEESDAMNYSISSDGVEVFLPDPGGGCLGMSPLGPLPQHREECMVHFAEGLMRSFPLYLRTCCPRKSKPSSIWVRRGFSGESSSPRYAHELLHQGLHRLFQDFFRFASDTKIVSCAYKVHFLLAASSMGFGKVCS